MTTLGVMPAIPRARKCIQIAFETTWNDPFRNDARVDEGRGRSYPSARWRASSSISAFSRLSSALTLDFTEARSKASLTLSDAKR